MALGRTYELEALPTVRVVSVPARHPYVERITAGSGVEMLADPAVPGTSDGRWWPPVALDPAWIAAHASQADLLHIHFGTESFSLDHLARTVDAAHTARWPVFLTVHDLQHPQLRDQAPYEEQLAVLLGRVDEVLTLTPGAAREIHARWSREARVLPHPRLLADHLTPDVPTSEVRRVGLFLKDLRPNVDGPAATQTLGSAVDLLAAAGHEVIGEVRMHDDVRDERARQTVRWLCAQAPRLHLVEHARLGDEELAAELAALDACLLPYVHGTHSGWLELCWDLGVPVAAPRVGFFREQHDDGSVASFVHDPGGASLAAALARLFTRAEGGRTGTPDRTASIHARRIGRRAQERELAAEHAALYRCAIAERTR